MCSSSSRPRRPAQGRSVTAIASEVRNPCGAGFRNTAWNHHVRRATSGKPGTSTRSSIVPKSCVVPTGRRPKPSTIVLSGAVAKRRLATCLVRCDSPHEFLARRQRSTTDGSSASPARHRRDLRLAPKQRRGSRPTDQCHAEARPQPSLRQPVRSGTANVVLAPSEPTWTRAALRKQRRLDGPTPAPDV